VLILLVWHVVLERFEIEIRHLNHLVVLFSQHCESQDVPNRLVGRDIQIVATPAGS
jgi:hypothetical protein